MKVDRLTEKARAIIAPGKGRVIEAPIRPGAWSVVELTQLPMPDASIYIEEKTVTAGTGVETTSRHRIPLKSHDKSLHERVGQQLDILEKEGVDFPLSSS